MEIMSLAATLAVKKIHSPVREISMEIESCVSVLSIKKLTIDIFNFLCKLSKLNSFLYWILKKLSLSKFEGVEVSFPIQF